MRKAVHTSRSRRVDREYTHNKIYKIQDEIEQTQGIQQKRQLSILETIIHIAISPITVARVVLSCPYGASYTTLLRKAEELQFEIEDEEVFKREIFLTKRVLRRLRNEGLIEMGKSGMRAFFSATLRGCKKVVSLRKQEQSATKLKRYSYEESETPIVCAYDIPEKMHRERDWIRGELRYFGFKHLQKSLCIGNIKIPKEFINDIKQKGLAGCVHIFSVNKRGTTDTTEEEKE